MRLLKLLDEEFDILFAASGSVSSLRELVLESATRGGVVPQLPSEEPASELLRRINATKGPAKNAKGGRRSASASSDLAPSGGLPPGWERVPLGRVVLQVQIGPFGSLLHKSDYISGGIPLVNPQNIREGSLIPTEGKTVSMETTERLAKYLLRSRDVVVARRGEMGRCAVVSEAEDGWLCGTGSLFLRFNEDIHPPFIALVLRSPTGRGQLGGGSVGMTMKNLNQGVLENLIVDLPPLGEQKRIVAKVDELLALCDELAAQQEEQKASRERLNAAALDALLSADDPDEFETRWRRIYENFDLLYDVPESLDSLRSTIFELAVRGRLVPQVDGTPPAQDIVDRLASEKRRLVAEKKLRAAPRLPAMNLEAAPFDLPVGWAWVRPDEICTPEPHSLAIGPFGSNLLQEDYRDSGVPLVFVREIRAACFGDAKTKFVTEEKGAELSAHQVRGGDLLITKMGAPPGDTALYPSERPPAVITADCIKFSVRPSDTLTAYLRYVYRAPSMRERLLDITKGVAHQKMSLKRFRGVPIPLPPLEEQRRLIEKIDQLTALCDDLEARLQGAQKLGEKLVASVVNCVVSDT